MPPVPISSIVCRGKNGPLYMQSSRGRNCGARDAIARGHLRDGAGRFLCHAVEPGQRARNQRALLSHARGPRAGKSRHHDRHAGAYAAHAGQSRIRRCRRARRRAQISVGDRGRAVRGRDPLGGDAPALGDRPGGGIAAARNRGRCRPARRRPELSEPLASAFCVDARSAIAPGAGRPALHHDQPAIFLAAGRMPGGRSVSLFPRARERPGVWHRHGHDRGRALCARSRAAR